MPVTNSRWQALRVCEAAITAISSSRNCQRSAWPRSTSASSWNGLAEERKEVTRAGSRVAACRRPSTSITAASMRWRDSRVEPRHARTARPRGPTRPRGRSTDDDETILGEEIRGFDSVDVDARTDVTPAAVLQVPALEVSHRILVLKVGDQIAGDGVDPYPGLGRKIDEVHFVSA